MKPATVARVAELLEVEFGVCFSEARRERLLASIEQAARKFTQARGSHGQRSTWAGAPVAVRWDLAPEFLQRVCDSIALTESYFLRDVSQVSLLREQAIPEVIERRRGMPVRAWSAGCAGGEEAYSLAMLLAEAGLDGRYEVVGSDISSAALARAAAAVYGDWSLRGVDGSARRRWFEPDGESHRVQPAIASSVRFEWLNLADARSRKQRPFDIVLCRNVLIYLTPAAATRVADNLVDAMAPGAWLLTAPSDPPLAHPELERVRTANGFAYRRRPDGAPCALRPSGGTRSVRTVRPPQPPQRGIGPVQRMAHVARPPDPALPPHRPVRADVSAWTAEVRRLGDEGSYQEAAAVAERVLADGTSDAELRVLYAVVQLELGCSEGAVAAATAAVLLDPDMAVAHLALASARRMNGDTDGAARAARQAKRILESMAPDARVPGADGQPAGWLAAVTESVVA